MKFGKIADQNLLDAIDFSLPEAKKLFDTPPDPLLIEGERKIPVEDINTYHPRTNGVHASVRTDDRSGFSIYVGSPKWGVKEWIGKIYPEKTKAKDFLKEYSKSFSSIELNTTHYRVPNLKTVEGWYSDAASDFKFAPKIPQRISHYGGLNNINYINEFADSIRPLKEKLGIVFLQLSENFSPKRGNELKFFMEHWPKDIKLAIEFRHVEWFLENNKVWKFMAEKNIGSVISDTAGRRDVLHSNLTSHFVVIRFVGNNLYKTDFSRIDMWTKRLREFRDAGVREVYFFVHEPEDINCPEIGQYFVDKVKNVMGVELKSMKFQESKENLGLF